MKLKRILAVLMLVAVVALGVAVALPLPEAGAAPLLVRTTATVATIAPAGVTQSLGAANGDGHKFLNTGQEFVLITNSYTDTITATFVTPGTIGPVEIADLEVSLAAGATKLIGPFLTGVFNQPSGTDKNRVYLNWNSEVTGTVASSVTFQVYKLD